MNKTELLRELAERTELTQKTVDGVLTALTDTVLETLAADHDETVSIPGLVKFSVKEVAEKSGVAALAGGKPWTVPAHSEVKAAVPKSVKTLA